MLPSAAIREQASGGKGSPLAPGLFPRSGSSCKELVLVLNLMGEEPGMTETPPKGCLFVDLQAEFFESLL